MYDHIFLVAIPRTSTSRFAECGFNSPCPFLILTGSERQYHIASLPHDTHTVRRSISENNVRWPDVAAAFAISSSSRSPSRITVVALMTPSSSSSPRATPVSSPLVAMRRRSSRFGDRSLSVAAVSFCVLAVLVAPAGKSTLSYCNDNNKDDLHCTRMYYVFDSLYDRDRVDLADTTHRGRPIDWCRPYAYRGTVPTALVGATTLKNYL